MILLIIVVEVNLQNSENFYETIKCSLNVLFKTNLLKEKGWDSKFCYNTFIFYDNIDKFHFMTTFVFVNHNKEDWGLTDSRTIKSYNVY